MACDLPLRDVPSLSRKEKVLMINTEEILLFKGYLLLIFEVVIMTVKINTKDGQIELSDDVIATVVGGSATEIFGVVGMASKSAIRDNFQALLGKENYAKGVVVKSTDAGITVDVYTVMSYGVKISEVSKNIQERVKFNLENQLGIKAETVNVYVQNIKVVGEN